VRPSIIPSVPLPTDDPGLDYLIIGHVTRDITPQGDRMGGTASYAGLTAAAYGVAVSLVTSCTPGCDVSALDGIRIHRVLSGRPTSFENRYTGELRQQWVRSTAEPLGAVHIPQGWFAPAIVHLAPVIGEVKPVLLESFPHSLRCVTLQGWMRRVESGGRVRPALPAEAEAAARGADASVFSLDDVGGDEALAERLAALSPVAAVTRGAEGCRIYAHGTAQAIPAPREREVDPTGAGDIFAAVFFLRLKETGDPAEAGRLAVALASLSVTRAGLAGVPTAAEILEAKRTVAAA
jgi:hypothetical protein